MWRLDWLAALLVLHLFIIRTAAGKKPVDGGHQWLWFYRVRANDQRTSLKNTHGQPESQQTAVVVYDAMLVLPISYLVP